MKHIGLFHGLDGARLGFHGGAADGNGKAHFFRHVVEAAASDTSLRETLFGMSNTHGTCSDGRILTFSALEIKVLEFDTLSGIDPADLSRKGPALLSLSRNLFRLEQVEKLAARCSSDGRFCNQGARAPASEDALPSTSSGNAWATSSSSLALSLSPLEGCSSSLICCCMSARLIPSAASVSRRREYACSRRRSSRDRPGRAPTLFCELSPRWKP
ncbi:MAG TPA: hypothetical protein ENI30_11560 [Gammaproteobacteria bacterium]|nr:hypothetical protein [Gammaproteobacteria bacterium]